MAALLELNNICKRFGNVQALNDVSLHVAKGETVAIIGPSGSGKSTLLRALVGLLRPAKGQVLYRGEDFWAGSETERQKLLSGVGLLFQSGALWSSMTLAENVALPLQRYTELSPAEIREQTSLKLALVGLAGFEDFYPSEISGGMRKRTC